ncbi:MAG: LysR family transcriptional regulator, partial [Sphingomonadales bacterium]|nr:LysR family transcriptional regulator [Sphingomonadales bacterium]
ECFSRLGTIWQTAEELNLTRSAISHQLRGLEADLPFPLLDRVGTHVELTPQGIRYAEDVASALRLLVGSAARNAGAKLVGKLTISCEPSFASIWLCNVIGDFAAEHKDLDLEVVTPLKSGSITTHDIDIYITFGTGNIVGMQSFHLADVESSPVCSPSLLNALGGDMQASDLTELTLLHLVDYSDWAAWFAASDLPPAPAERGIVFADMHLIYAAALAGQGVALGDTGLAQSMLADGRLIRPFSQTIRDSRAYYCSVPDNLLEKPAVMAFTNWLRREEMLGGSELLFALES